MGFIPVNTCSSNIVIMISNKQIRVAWVWCWHLTTSQQYWQFWKVFYFIPRLDYSTSILRSTNSRATNLWWLTLFFIVWQCPPPSRIKHGSFCVVAPVFSNPVYIKHTVQDPYFMRSLLCPRDDSNSATTMKETRGLWDKEWSKHLACLGRGSHRETCITVDRLV